MSVTDYSMVRYLLAKQRLDDRSLNGPVAKSLSAWVDRQPQPIKVLELGAGVGTMLSRLVSWGTLEQAHYTLLDADAVSLAAAREHLKDWATNSGLLTSGQGDGSTLLVSGAQVNVSVDFVQADALAFELPDTRAAGFDLLIANSVLDLMDLKTALARLWRLCRGNAAYWFTLNFDGETIFLPTHPHDEVIIGAYHASMDQRLHNGRAAGHSQTGRRLLQTLLDARTSLIEAGSSDWILFPKDGVYEGDERYFIEHILHFVETSVGGATSVPAGVLNEWLTARRASLAAGKLTYIAKQLDVFGLAPDPSPVS